MMAKAVSFIVYGLSGRVSPVLHTATLPHNLPSGSDGPCCKGKYS
jgi:hypothetical protein